MKILVTGGAGYIGSHTIIEILEKTDWEVISIDNFSNSDSTSYDRIKEITGKEISHYNVDLKNIDDTRKVFSENSDIDSIIHFAAYKAVGESVKQPLKYYDNNLNSLKNILSCQKEFNVPHLIFSSSCSVYGNIASLPVSEATPINTVESPYAYTKQIGEKMIEDFLHSNKDQKAISLRYFNPVGAHISGLTGEVQHGTPNNLVPFITQTAIGKRESLTIFGNNYPTHDGTCIRDYIHVTDIANAHMLAIKKLHSDKNYPQHDIINLGTGTGVSILEVINAFESSNNIELSYEFGPIREGDVVSIYADNTKAKEVLGWTLNHNLNDMMSSAWKWELNSNKN